MKRPKLLLVFLAFILILTACSGSSETDTESVEEIVAEEAPAPTDVPPTATPEPPPTEEPVMLPVSMVTAPVGEGDFNSYKVSLPGLAPLEFE